MEKFDELIFNSPNTQEIFNSIFEITSEVVWILDVKKDRSVWLASDENKVKYAIRPRIEGVPDDHWVVGIHPEDRDSASQGYEKAKANPAITFFEHEYRFRGASNQYFYIKDKMKFWRNASGEAEMVVGVWCDITDRLFREEQLDQMLTSMEDDRRRFRIISEVSNAAMWEVDFLSGKIRWTAGKAALNDLGLSSEFRPLEEWEKAIHPEDRSRALNYFYNVVLSDENKYKDEYRIIKPDGTVAHMVDQGYIVRDAEGKALRALGGWIDITGERCRELELKELLERQDKMIEELSAHEEELASSEEELRQINEQLGLNLQILTERDFIISQSQKVAKIGSWEFEPDTLRTEWSDELYNILGVNKNFDRQNFQEVLSLFEENSGIHIVEKFRGVLDRKYPNLDFVAQVRTPIGYRKWVRITAYTVFEKNRIARMVGLVFDITMSKESEERLKASEEKFSKAFRNNPDLMNIVREEDRMIMDVNERAYAMLGYTREELIGTSAADLNLYVYEEERNAFFKEYELSGQVDMESTWRRKDGGHIQVLVSSSRLELEGQKCILSVVRDISDRRIAEERFEKAFDLSPDLMLIFREQDGVLVEANSKLTEFSGYSREETIGKSSDEFMLWADETERNKFLEHYAVTGYMTDEARFYKKGKIPFFATVSGQRILLHEENHMLIVVRDITDKKQAEEKLIESEANLNATINNTTLMVWSVDREFRLIKFNEPFRKYMQQEYGLDLLVGAIGDVSELRPSWIERYTRALAGETVKISEQSRGFYFDFSLNPIIDNGKIMGVSVFAEDVTERVEKEKALAEALNKIGELKLMALRSVMNPHFIFNALNSIQYFIAQNDRKNAINYLSTFSKLVRGILTHSLSNKIKLSEELEQLRNYVSLEQMRFEDKFSFDVKIVGQLDLDAIEIPSLLVQPYVENAILHGLYNKEGKGLLKICVMEENGSIVFEIEDNGIGRAAAMDLRNHNFPKHKSMGTALTEERLKLINAQDKIAFEILDLYDDHKRPQGTKVRIWVKE
ncbi:MAG: hypothetical protein DI538_19460 [Azospira oryzae]|nr:MAG: hypothetical protein DI538_19460 [Azospira oryzae]